MNLPLIEKYRAQSFDEIYGQDKAIQELKTFYKLFPRKRAVILNGPVGVGKTSLALALAKEYGLELFELNASDLRNRISLEEVLKPATLQQSLFNKGKIILMDEADGITASDRGGLPELISLIQKTTFPIIITANDIWQKKFSLLRKKCQIIDLKEPSDDVLMEVVKKVLHKECLSINEETLKILVKNAKGDVRASLNNLQTVISFGEDTFISELSEREKQESIFSALKTVFQGPTNRDTLRVYENTRMELDEISLWIEENIPSEYQGKALAKAFDSLSKADIFKGRVYRQQYWRFLVYQNFFLSAGISSATKLKTNKFISYKRSSRILKIWMANQRYAKKKSIISKYARATHMSKKKAMKESFLLPLILNNEMQDKLELDEKEQEYLLDRKGAIIISNGLNRFRI
jgi:replication factor C large subunit